MNSKLRKAVAAALGFTALAGVVTDAFATGIAGTVPVGDAVGATSDGRPPYAWDGGNIGYGPAGIPAGSTKGYAYYAPNQARVGGANPMSGSAIENIDSDKNLGWNHNTNWYVFRIAVEGGYTVSVDRVTEGTSFQPAFSLFTSGNRAWDAAGNSHSFNQVAAPGTGPGRSPLNAIGNGVTPPYMVTGGADITGFVGYANSGAGYVNGEGFTVLGALEAGTSTTGPLQDPNLPYNEKTNKYTSIVTKGVYQNPHAGVIAEGYDGVGSSVNTSDPTQANANGGGHADLQVWLPVGYYAIGPGGSCADFTCSATTAQVAKLKITVMPNASVTAPNLAPVAEAKALPRISSSGSTVMLDGSKSYDRDAGGSIASYRWTQKSGLPVTLSDPQSATPTFTSPTVTQDETLSFELVVTDNLGKSSSAATVDVVVQDNPTGIPFADAGVDHSVLGGAQAILDGSLSSDPTSQPLTYQWSQVSPATPKAGFAEGFSATMARTAMIMPDVGADAVFTFKLVVKDTDGKISEDTVDVTVKKKNHAPMADAGPDIVQRIGTKATVTLDGSGSLDPDNDALSYLWIQVDGPVTTLSDVTAQKPTFPAPAGPASYIFALTVSDGNLSSTMDMVNIKVGDYNNPPTVQIEPVNPVKEQLPVTLHGSASDPDGDDATLTYAWTQIAGPIVQATGADTADLSFTAPWVPPGTTGELLFKLTVNDNFAAQPKSADKTVKVTVQDDAALIDCSAAHPSRARLWPASGGMAAIKIDGITGANITAKSKPYDLKITSVSQDEPVKNPTLRDKTGPDAKIVSPKRTARKPLLKDGLYLRAERQGTQPKKQPFSGDGRVYDVRFTASDGTNSCQGSVIVAVPPTKTGAAVAGEQQYDSTAKQ